MGIWQRIKDYAKKIFTRKPKEEDIFKEPTPYEAPTTTQEKEQLTKKEERKEPDRTETVEKPVTKPKEPEEKPEEKEKEEPEKIEMPKTSGTVKELETKIKPEGVNEVEIKTTELNLNHFEPIYRKLFSDNAKLADPQIIDVLIRHRKELRNRFVITVTPVGSDGQEITEIKLYGILPEEIGPIYDLVGTEDTKSSIIYNLKTTLTNYFREQNIKIGEPLDSPDPDTRVKLTNIHVKASFA